MPDLAPREPEPRIPVKRAQRFIAYLTAEEHQALKKEAQLRRISVDTLLGKIITVAATENLVGAILDDR
jgi:hypothetical protein